MEPFHRSGHGAESGEIVTVLRGGHTKDKLRVLADIMELGEGSASPSDYASDVAALLDDQDDEVVLGACEALANMGSAGAAHSSRIAALLSSLDGKKRCFAAGALGLMGPQAANHAAEVAALLADGSPAVRASAVMALGSMKAPGVAVDVAHCLQDSFADVVSGAITALSLMDDEGRAFTTQVAQKLSDPAPEVRAASVMYFAKLGGATEHAEALCGALKDEDLGVRQAAVRLFGALGPAAGPLVPGAARVLAFADRRFQAAAALALGACGHAGAAEAAAIARLLTDTSEDAHERVHCAAGIRGRPPSSLLIPACAAASALAALRESAYGPDIVKLLQEEHADVRVAAALALGELGGGFEHAVAELLRDTRARVRAAACAALGKLAQQNGPDQEVAQRVGALLSDASPVVRSAAADALARMGEAASALADTLHDLFQDRSLAVRVAAIRALGAVGSRGQCFASHIGACTRDPDVAIRIAAIETLAGMGERGAAFADEIADMVHDREQGIRVAAIVSLAKMGDAATPFLAAIESAKNDPQEAVRAAAAGAVHALTQAAIAE